MVVVVAMVEEGCSEDEGRQVTVVEMVMIVMMLWLVRIP